MDVILCYKVPDGWITSKVFNSLSNMLALCKLKAFADNSLVVVQVVQSSFDRVEYVVGKGENAS